MSNAKIESFEDGQQFTVKFNDYPVINPTDSFSSLIYQKEATGVWTVEDEPFEYDFDDFYEHESIFTLEERDAWLAEQAE